MANDWFRFRQFLVRQDQCAMKVGTDGVLLGAWAGTGEYRRILDVGTGTGLIALMCAQRFPEAQITAIEIDEPATLQAAANFKSSPWPGRLKVVTGDFLAFEPDLNIPFDLITCNPPYFKKSLKNPDDQRAAARHDDGLPPGLFFPKAVSLLSPHGRLALIFPSDRLGETLVLAAGAGLHLLRRTDVRGNPSAPVKRVLLEWGLATGEVTTSELISETGVRGVYSADYLTLTGDFYL